MLTLERLCGHLIRLIHAPVRIYDEAGTPIAVYVDNGEQQDIMDCDPAFRRMLLGLCGEPESVKLHLEADRILYAALRGKEQRCLMGPCSLDRDVESADRYLTRAHGLDARKPFRVYCAAMDDFCEATLMLYEAVTDKTLSVSELLLGSFCDDRLERIVDERINQIFYTMQENAALHNPYSQEAREQGAIRAGNPQALEKSFRETYVGKVGTLARDRLRHTKNLAIVLVTLAARSAIAGGLLPEISFSISDAYIQKAEELKNEGEILAMARRAEMEYCLLVKNTADNRNLNPLVVRCKELVLQRLHTKITVSGLAEELDINPNYLSQLFAKEVNLSLSDYIAREKINFAKRQLIFSEDSYETIAHSFGFVSQSHFGRVFKKWTGLTPGQFRETYGQGRP